MPKNIYNMSEEEMERIIDDFFDKTPKKVLIDIFKKAGFFEEFKPEEIKWEVFVPILSKNTFSSVNVKNDQWNIDDSKNNFISKEKAA
jgi:hypothetical protein